MSSYVTRRVSRSRSAQAVAIEPLESRQHLSAVVDVRLAGGGKSVAVSTVGQTINAEAWVTVTGPDANVTNDGLQVLIGSFLSKNISGGAANGTLSAILKAPFNGSGATVGGKSDLDGDGDLDVGSNVVGGSPAYFFARSDAMTTTGGTIAGKSVSFKVADLKFLVTTLNTGTRTEINFRPRAAAPSYYSAVWMEDNLRYGSPTGATLTIGAPLVVTRGGPVNNPPTAKLTASSITSGGGATTKSFTVTYTDETAVKVSTIDNADVRVTGPNGFSQLATKVSVSSSTDGTPRTATYRITAPGGTWNSADNGTYTVTMQANQVSDTTGKFVAAGSLGTFTTNISRFGTISGNVFRDTDADGVKDSTETTLTNAWRVYIDADKDGVFDSTERNVNMPSGGSSYSFGSLLPGTYRVRMVALSGNRFTVPTSGYYDITINENSFSGKNFGVTTNVLIKGNVFNDLNGDKLKGTGEGGLSNWRVYIDTDNDGILDTTETSVLTDSAGNFSFKTKPAGTYRIRIVQQSGWTRTTTASSYTVTLGSGATSSTLLFGEKRIV